MIEFASITVLYAWELTLVYMFYSQGGEFNTSLSRSLQLYCTHGQSISSLTVGQSAARGKLVVLGYVPWRGHVPPGMTLRNIMCVHYIHHQG